MSKNYRDLYSRLSSHQIRIGYLECCLEAGTYFDTPTEPRRELWQSIGTHAEKRLKELFEGTG